MNRLEARLLGAHAKNDRHALVGLYAEAGDRAHGVDARCFYLTQAYIFALEVGHVMRADLHARLVLEGREE